MAHTKDQQTWDSLIKTIWVKGNSNPKSNGFFQKIPPSFNTNPLLFSFNPNEVGAIKSKYGFPERTSDVSGYNAQIFPIAINPESNKHGSQVGNVMDYASRTDNKRYWWNVTGSNTGNTSTYFSIGNTDRSKSSACQSLELRAPSLINNTNTQAPIEEFGLLPTLLDAGNNNILTGEYKVTPNPWDTNNPFFDYFRPHKFDYIFNSLSITITDKSGNEVTEDRLSLHKLYNDEDICKNSTLSNNRKDIIKKGMKGKYSILDKEKGIDENENGYGHEYYFDPNYVNKINVNFDAWYHEHHHYREGGDHGPDDNTETVNTDELRRKYGYKQGSGIRTDGKRHCWVKEGDIIQYDVTFDGQHYACQEYCTFPTFWILDDKTKKPVDTFGKHDITECLDKIEARGEDDVPLVRVMAPSNHPTYFNRRIRKADWAGNNENFTWKYTVSKYDRPGTRILFPEVRTVQNWNGSRPEFKRNAAHQSFYHSQMYEGRKDGVLHKVRLLVNSSSAKKTSSSGGTWWKNVGPINRFDFITEGPSNDLHSDPEYGATISDISETSFIGKTNYLVHKIGNQFYITHKGVNCNNVKIQVNLVGKVWDNDNKLEDSNVSLKNRPTGSAAVVELTGTTNNPIIEIKEPTNDKLIDGEYIIKISNSSNSSNSSKYNSDKEFTFKVDRTAPTLNLKATTITVKENTAKATIEEQLKKLYTEATGNTEIDISLNIPDLSFNSDISSVQLSRTDSVNNTTVKTVRIKWVDANTDATQMAAAKKLNETTSAVTRLMPTISSTTTAADFSSLSSSDKSSLNDQLSAAMPTTNELDSLPALSGVTDDKLKKRIKAKHKAKARSNFLKNLMENMSSVKKMTFNKGNQLFDGLKIRASISKIDVLDKSEPINLGEGKAVYITLNAVGEETQGMDIGDSNKIKIVSCVKDSSGEDQYQCRLKKGGANWGAGNLKVNDLTNTKTKIKYTAGGGGDYNMEDGTGYLKPNDTIQVGNVVIDIGSVFAQSAQPLNLALTSSTPKIGADRTATIRLTNTSVEKITPTNEYPLGPNNFRCCISGNTVPISDASASFSALDTVEEGKEYTTVLTISATTNISDTLWIDMSGSYLDQNNFFNLYSSVPKLEVNIDTLHIGPTISAKNVSNTNDVANNNFTQDASLNITIVLSEEPKNINGDGTDVTLTKDILDIGPDCEVSAFEKDSSDPKVYTCILTPKGTGQREKTCTIKVKAEKYMDAVKNKNMASSVFTWYHDSLPPIDGTKPAEFKIGTVNYYYSDSYESTKILRLNKSSITTTDNSFNLSDTTNGIVVTKNVDYKIVFAGLGKTNSDASLGANELTVVDEGFGKTTFKLKFPQDRAKSTVNFYTEDNSFNSYNKLLLRLEDRAGNRKDYYYDVMIDIISPDITITCNTVNEFNNIADNKRLNNLNEMSITFTLSETPDSGSFTADDISATGGTIIQNFAQNASNNKIFTAKWKRGPPPSSAFDNFTLRVLSNKFQDRAGNNNSASGVLTWYYDINNSQVGIESQIINGAQISNGIATTSFDNISDAPGVWNGAFEGIINITDECFAGVNPLDPSWDALSSLSGLTKSGISIVKGNEDLSSNIAIVVLERFKENGNPVLGKYRIVINPSHQETYGYGDATKNYPGDGDYLIKVKAGAFKDSAGNSNNESSTFVWKRDRRPPNISIITQSTPDEPNKTITLDNNSPNLTVQVNPTTPAKISYTYDTDYEYQRIAIFNKKDSSVSSIDTFHDMSLNNILGINKWNNNAMKTIHSTGNIQYMLDSFSAKSATNTLDASYNHNLSSELNDFLKEGYNLVAVYVKDSVGLESPATYHLIEKDYTKPTVSITKIVNHNVNNHGAIPLHDSEADAINNYISDSKFSTFSHISGNTKIPHINVLKGTVQGNGINDSANCKVFVEVNGESIDPSGVSTDGAGGWQITGIKNDTMSRITLYDNSLNIIKIWADDGHKNLSVPKYVAVHMDITAPTITINTTSLKSNNNTPPITGNVSGTDLSGTKVTVDITSSDSKTAKYTKSFAHSVTQIPGSSQQISWSLDLSNPIGTGWAYTGANLNEVIVGGDSLDYTIKATVDDRVLNQSSVTETLTIDTKAPSILEHSLKDTQGNNGPFTYGTTVVLRIKASEELKLSTVDMKIQVMYNGQLIDVTTLGNTTVVKAPYKSGESGYVYKYKVRLCLPDKYANSMLFYNATFADLLNNIYSSINGMATINQAGITYGDPYVWPMRSTTPIKLPNITASYRMFEQGKTYINALVDEATDEHKQRMKNYVEKAGSKLNAITDGFFYQKVFIHCNGHELCVNMSNKDVETTAESREFFNIKAHQNKKSTTYTVAWVSETGSTMALELMFHNNPHIENGISLVCNVDNSALGMLIDSYKPKTMSVPRITTAQYNKIHTRAKKLQNHNKGIQPKGESWIMKGGKIV